MEDNREYKSDVFSMLLQEPENALEIYNGLNGTNYENPEDVEIYLLEKGVSLSIHNDASFIINMHLNLYEHQSTYNPNIPLRDFIYLANMLQKLVCNRDLYGRRLVRIPTPHFAVFYNGIEERPEVEELKLSTAFEHSEEEPEVELKCIVYNINSGKNKKLLKKCGVLKDYMYFVDKVRCYQKKYGNLTEGISHAIDDCIEHHVLEKFFIQHRTEVIKAMQLDYTWERREELIRKEEYEEGRQEGVAQMIETVKKLKQGISSEELIHQGMDEKIVRMAETLL